MPYINGLLTVILGTHALAALLFPDAVRRHYPHPVRPVAEHVPFGKSSLAVTSAFRVPQLIRVLLNAVFRHLRAIETLISEAASTGVRTPDFFA